MDVAVLLCGVVALMDVNAWARMLGRRWGRAVLLATTAPAIALATYAGVRLGYAIVFADEVNRRFREGDLSYFGADIAFAATFFLGGIWCSLALLGFIFGKRLSDQP